MEDAVWKLNAEKVISEIKKGNRFGGRKLDEYRPLKVENDISKNAEGSAKVTLGETQVLAGLKIITGEPYPDSPDEGTISVGMELLPLASPDFEVGPPREESIELSRVIDRGIRESKMIDFKKLCVTEGELVWIAFIDMYAMNHAGNLFDAGSLGALAALKHTKLPKIEDGKIVPKEYAGQLKLEKNASLCTFAKIGNTLVLDPDLAEEKAASARFSVATTDDGYISAFQKGLPGTFTEDEITQAIEIAFEQGKKMRKQIK